MNDEAEAGRDYLKVARYLVVVLLLTTLQMTEAARCTYSRLYAIGNGSACTLQMAPLVLSEQSREPSPTPDEQCIPLSETPLLQVAIFCAGRSATLLRWRRQQIF